MAAPKEILDLVEEFERDQSFYKSAQFNETELRTRFINPLIAALGWDVYHDRPCRADQHEVKEEDSVEVEGKIKNPDYSFRLFDSSLGSMKRKFFIEVKRPSINIEAGAYPAFQLRRYAWSADLPISILTDFEELSVYYCLSRPGREDKPAKSRIMYLRYDQYREKWEEIAALFSREAVLNGSLDKYARTLPQKRGEKRVDAALLGDISKWREALAKNIAMRNPELDTASLNYSVQAIIDRIMFLRICEDRGIEQYMRLKHLLEGERVYARLFELFQQADERYNSGIFHFHKEPGRDRPDIITPGLKIDDGILKEIIKQLYFPESPYAFSVLPAEILGQIYEQFLGQVIRLDEGHVAQVEDKPEVKKAGGVKYTPAYIVEAIVKKTLGPTLEGKTARQASEISVLDPACGSGSFLIVAYQYLLDWHRDWYLQHLLPLMERGSRPSSPEIRRLLPETEAGQRGRKREAELPIYQARDGEWRLTTVERKRILLSNIYGVDIDRQAVEVTKLSLLLKVLEGENEETISKQLTLSRRALPDLDENIKCGNSLIGWDILEDNPELGQEEIERINPFDWEREFAEVFKRGGFGVVIGNPPYVNVTNLGNDMKAQLSKRFSSASRRFDLYIPFTEKSINLLSNGGLLGFIMPSMFMRREYGISLREYISKNSSFKYIVDFGTYQVFNGVLNYVNIFIIIKLPFQKMVSVIKIEDNKITEQEIKRALMGEEIKGISAFQVPGETFSNSGEWYLSNRDEKRFTQALFDRFSPIQQILAYASEGIHSGKDEVFFVLKSKANELGLESPPTFPLAKGKDIHRYKHIASGDLKQRVIYPYEINNGNVYSPEIMQEIAPNTWNYLLGLKEALSGRPYFDRSNKNWYELWCPRNPEMFTSQKIVVPEITNKGNFTLIKDQIFVNTKVKVIIPKKDVAEKIEYLLGLLNSKLLVYLLRSIAPPKSGGFYAVKTRIVGKLPFRKIDFSDPADVARHDRMVALVEQMLSLHKQLPQARTPHEQTALERQIEATDRQIDALVYELYGLTEEEIGIVEGRE